MVRELRAADRLAEAVQLIGRPARAGLLMVPPLVRGVLVVEHRDPGAERGWWPDIVRAARTERILLAWLKLPVLDGE